MKYRLPRKSSGIQKENQRLQNALGLAHQAALGCVSAASFTIVAIILWSGREVTSHMKMGSQARDLCPSLLDT